MALRTSDYLIALFKKSPNWKKLSDEELSQLKKVMVSIADDFVKTCDKYDLRYIMSSGTCLGAVRHKGFIPWDDDIDFEMPRKDYLKFLEIAEKELGEKYYIKSVAKNDKVNFPTIHIRLKNSRYVNFGDMVLTENEPIEERGIYIDIFPTDSVSSVYFFRLLHQVMCLTLYYIASSIVIHKSIDKLKNNDVVIDSEAKKVLFFKNVIGTIFGVIPLHKWMKLIDRTMSMHHDANSKLINAFTGKHIEKYVVERKKVYGEKNIGVFEGHHWCNPTDVHEYLIHYYDENYMIMPPEEKRKIHPVFELEFPCDN